jgi:hypothetical protein
MTLQKLLPRLAAAGFFLFLLGATGSTASAQNVLVNPGFETGPVGFGAPGWFTFGNGFTESANPCIVPFAGNQLMKMFGTFNPFGVSGIFQEFPTAPGDVWTLSAKSRHCSDDPMLGNHVLGGSGNWVVQKLAFFDAANVEIGASAVESTILDGSYATDTWFNNAPISGTAPAGCVKVQAFVLYLQPGYDGGAAQIDEVSLTKLIPVPAAGTSWGNVKALYRN